MNIRAKGQNGEREIATILNGILITVLKDRGAPQEEITKATKSVQRNQNQSAVGGGDLTHTWGMCIEIKRQETLNLNTWWKQCQESAIRNKEWPVLLYRQNKKPWMCRTIGYLGLPDGTDAKAVVDLSYIDFQNWYKHWVNKKLDAGEMVRA